MTTFTEFRNAIQANYERLANHNLYQTDVDKSFMWEVYLDSFAEGDNPVYKTNTEHDCNCCKSYIKRMANVVAIIDNKMVSLFDITLPGKYQVVADALAEEACSYPIRNIFLSTEKVIGADHNHKLEEDGEITTFNHFHTELKNQHVSTDKSSALGSARDNKHVLMRSVEEITSAAIKDVIDLIEDNNLLRGESQLQKLQTLLRIKVEVDAQEFPDLYYWEESVKLGLASRIKNSSIGTLLIDLSEGVPIERAVKSYEDKVSGTNYQRPKKLATKNQIADAEKTINDKGLMESLYRRFAVTEDITINDVLWANRDAKRTMGVFDELRASVNKAPKTDTLEEVSIKDFMSDILPTADSIELLLTGDKTNNMVSLLAPTYKDAPSILKWDNNFSWSYQGEVADSMKQRVKAAGGKVDGELRFSIQWNDGDNNQNDFDAHCVEPTGNTIKYDNKSSCSGGKLDVDITRPGGKVAVENITWAKCPLGIHKFLVHNYSDNGGTTGFTAEIEYKGKVYSYCYDRRLSQGEKVIVAKVNITENGITFIDSLPSEATSKNIWGLDTENFHKVEMIMHSPNYWEGNNTGNRHWFFMLENCINPNDTRGYYNEFLRSDLQQDKRVFEMLASKMKAKTDSNQLSGLGFTAATRNSVTCRVTGPTTRIINIKF